MIAIAVVAIPTASAEAVGTGDPHITSPWDVSTGTTYGYGFAPALRISLADAPAGEYEWTVECIDDAGYFETGTFNYEGTDTSPDVIAEDLPAIRGKNGIASDCTASVADTATGLHQDSITFRVDGKPLAIRNVSLSRDSFYPTVRDGFQDTTKIRYELSRAARVRIDVRNEVGRAVRTDALGWQTNRKSWTWNGRKDNGDKVAPGRYTMRISARTADGSTDEASRTVRVATGWKVVHESRSRRAMDTSSRSHAGNCYIDGFIGQLHLDCWGGRYARASWRFSIPRKAYNVSWSLPGEQGCCSSPGHITRWGQRTSAGVFTIGIEVTGWRAYYVDKARISYSYKRRI